MGYGVALDGEKAGMVDSLLQEKQRSPYLSWRTVGQWEGFIKASVGDLLVGMNSRRPTP